MIAWHQIAAIVCFVCTAYRFVSPVVANEPLHAELLEHGKRQVENMIKDRPNMGAYPTDTGFKLVRPTDPFYELAVRKFAGEDTSSPVFWDAAEPATEAEHTIPFRDDIGSIRVSRNIKHEHAGEWKGKEKAFELLWLHAVFELHNIAGAASFLDLHDRALNGRIEREAYIMGSAKTEHAAYLTTNKFFKEKWLPWAIEVQLLPSAQRFFVNWDRGPTTFDDWISQYTDRKSYPWVPFGESFDEADKYRRSFGPPTADRTLSVDYWKALQKVQHDLYEPLTNP